MPVWKNERLFFFSRLKRCTWCTLLRFALYVTLCCVRLVTVWPFMIEQCVLLAKRKKMKISWKEHVAAKILDCFPNSHYQHCGLALAMILEGSDCQWRSPIACSTNAKCWKQRSVNFEFERWSKNLPKTILGPDKHLRSGGPRLNAFHDFLVHGDIHIDKAPHTIVDSKRRKRTMVERLVVCSCPQILLCNPSSLPANLNELPPPLPVHTATEISGHRRKGGHVFADTSDGGPTTSCFTWMCSWGYYWYVTMVRNSRR